MCFEISRERSRIVIVVVYVVFVSSDDGLLRVFFCHFLLAFDFVVYVVVEPLVLF